MALEAEFPEQTIKLATTHEEAMKNVSWMEILVTYGSQLNDNLIGLADNLRWIHTLSSGTDWVWKLDSLDQDVLVTSTRGIHGPPVSEMALMMMMGLGRGFPTFIDNQRIANWARFPGSLLHSKTVGIFGVGAIAEELAPKCNALGMTVIGISESERSIVGMNQIYSRRELPQVVPQLDYLILLSAHTPDTDSIINAEVCPIIIIIII